MALVRFMNTSAGRALRVGLGVTLIVVGLAVVGGAGGIALAVVGILPLATGALDVCMLGPLFGASLRGTRR